MVYTLIGESIRPPPAMSVIMRMRVRVRAVTAMKKTILLRRFYKSMNQPSLHQEADLKEQRIGRRRNARVSKPLRTLPNANHPDLSISWPNSDSNSGRRQRVRLLSGLLQLL